MILTDRKSTINGLWYVPSTDVNKDNHKEKVKVNNDNATQNACTAEDLNPEQNRREVSADLFLNFLVGPRHVPSFNHNNNK